MFIETDQRALPKPEDIYERLVEDCPEFMHLKEGQPVVKWLYKMVPTVRQGRDVLGTVYVPSVQGQLKPMFEWMMEEKWGFIPDFLVVLDLEYWLSADELDREILVFHETCHMRQKEDQYGMPAYDKTTGEPKWDLAGHDVEEFVKVVARYGAWSAEIQALVAASKRQI